VGQEIVGANTIGQSAARNTLPPPGHGLLVSAILAGAIFRNPRRPSTISSTTCRRFVLPPSKPGVGGSSPSGRANNQRVTSAPADPLRNTPRIAEHSGRLRPLPRHHDGLAAAGVDACCPLVRVVEGLPRGRRPSRCRSASAGSPLGVIADLELPHRTAIADSVVTRVSNRTCRVAWQVRLGR
jgi:hypothetical protein